MVTDRFKVLLQRLYPHHPLSRLVHRATRRPCGALCRWLMRRFIGHFSIEMGQYQSPDPASYPTFNAFFTRALAPGARPIDPDPRLLVSPVDGVVSEVGTIDDEQILQAKGHHYRIGELLAAEPVAARRFRNGHFITIYLSPRDYHRIHAPHTARVEAMTHVAGSLFSVNPATTRALPGLFARNERVVVHLNGNHSHGGIDSALVMVGAIFVGSIETVWAGEVTPPAGRGVVRHDYPVTSAPMLQRGEELGRFNMGSTVILLYPAGSVEWLPDLVSGRSVRMGEAIATIRPDHRSPPPG